MIGTASPVQINKSSSVGRSGPLSEGLVDSFQQAMKRKYGTIPPLVTEGEEGIHIRALQFEHFHFPHHAMIDWEREGPYRVFRFIPDSIEVIETFENGFRYQNSSTKQWIEVLNLNKGAASQGKQKTYSMVEMPIPDFDIYYSDSTLLGRKYEKDGKKMEATVARGELKILIGPQIQQRNIYPLPELPTDSCLIIEPPFLVFFRANPEAYPYFAARFEDAKLLLK